jgi:hypothetical protein
MRQRVTTDVPMGQTQRTDLPQRANDHITHSPPTNSGRVSCRVTIRHSTDDWPGAFEHRSLWHTPDLDELNHLIPLSWEY